MKKVFTVIFALFVIFAFATVSIAAKKTGTGKTSIEENMIDEKQTIKTGADKKKNSLEPDPWTQTNKTKTKTQQKTN